jgi:pimeloyl-ACP methyl ester carboxylesterase
MSLQRLAISVSTPAIVFRLAAFKATAFGSKLSRASVKRRLIASGSDHGYGNWSKKARSYTSLLFNASRWFKLQKTLILPGCGHWTQQERPQEVNRAMREFLRRL